MEDKEDRFRLCPGVKVDAGVEEDLRAGVKDTEGGPCFGLGVE